MAELATAWAGSTAVDIILAPGTYSQASALTSTTTPHRLWSEQLLGATVRVGLAWGSNTRGLAGEVHGIAFDVPEVSRCSSLGLLSEAIVLTWGLKQRLVVEDCTFDGNGVVGSAVQATAPSGCSIKRCTMTGFVDFGLMAYKNGGAGVTEAMTIEDLDISEIKRATPGSSEGLAEAGIWLGHPSTTRRIKIRGTGWTGLALVGGVAGAVCSDLDIDDVATGYRDPGGRGVALELSSDSSFTRVYVGPSSMFGFGIEWDHGDPTPRNSGITIRHATLDSYKAGISADIGTAGLDVANCRISRAWLSGINVYQTTGTVIDHMQIEYLLGEDVDPIGYGHHLGYDAEPPVGWPATPDVYDVTPYPRRRVEYAEP